jgi:hypothetical protein
MGAIVTIAIEVARHRLELVIMAYIVTMLCHTGFKLILGLAYVLFLTQSTSDDIHYIIHVAVIGAS